MLPTGEHVLSVWSELIAAVAAGALLVDCSTIDVESARKAHALARKKGGLTLDGPVSGGTVGASAATLTFMVGGSDEAGATEVTSTSSGQCWAITTNCPVPGPVPTSPANRGYKPGFSTAMMLKDLRLAQEASLATGASTPLGAEAAHLYNIFERLGHGGEDFSAIINFLRGNADA
jgi:3-hydroxyisobutyrate dehydrogenase